MVHAEWFLQSNAVPNARPQAYIVQERQRAEDMGYSDPICPTMQDTHDNYDRCVLRMLPKIKVQ